MTAGAGVCVCRGEWPPSHVSHESNGKREIWVERVAFGVSILACNQCAARKHTHTMPQPCPGDTGREGTSTPTTGGSSERWGGEDPLSPSLASAPSQLRCPGSSPGFGDTTASPSPVGPIPRGPGPAADGTREEASSPACRHSFSCPVCRRLVVLGFATTGFNRVSFPGEIPKDA